jgi:hypothetical protein
LIVNHILPGQSFFGMRSVFATLYYLYDPFIKDISGAILAVDLSTNGQDSSMATPHHLALTATPRVQSPSVGDPI